MNFNNTLEIIQTQGQENKISADTLLNIITTTVENVSMINKEDAALAPIEDEGLVVSKLAYLSSVMVNALKNLFVVAERVNNFYMDEITVNRKAIEENGKRLDEVKQHIIESEQVEKDLIAVKADLDAKIDEKQSHLTCIHYAWSAMSQRPDFPEILKEIGVADITSIKDFSSLQELLSWLDSYSKALQHSLDLYSKIYKNVLNAINKPNESRGN